MPLPGRERLPLGHQADGQPLEHGADPGHIVQPEPADHDAAVLGDDGAQHVPVPGRPVQRVAGLGLQHRGPAGGQVHAEHRRGG